ncbi:MAG TPA: GNAT family N-acetyltransferase [Gammaproteobacteria bacterium]|jgi:GNAT superfamily N-acetyltransferase
MTDEAADVRIEPGTKADVPVILSLIRQLAEYEKLAHEVTASEQVIRDSLFGPKPAAEVLLAHAGSVPIGFAVFFQNFSTFLGKPGIYLEDLFVLPDWRRKGVGKRLLSSVAALAVARGCGRFEWAVLDWNEPALRFYKSLGTRVMDDWRICRLTGDALQRVASQDHVDT